MRLVDGVLRALGRLPLWLQFAALGFSAVAVPLWVISDRFLVHGQQILIDHETIDLGDEANLRAGEFKEAFEALVRDLRQVGRRLNAAGPGEFGSPARAALSAFAAGFELTTPHPANAPASVTHVRRRFFGQAVVGSVAGPIDSKAEWPVGVSAKGEPGFGPDELAQAALADLAQRLRRPTPAYVSGFFAAPGRCLVAVGAPARWEANTSQPTHLLAMVVDFAQYMENRRRNSPRHYYLVLQPTGQLVTHPPEWPAGATWNEVVPPTTNEANPTWIEAARHGLPTSGESPANRAARDARMLQQGGVRLPENVIPALRSYYRKGEFGGTLQGLLGPAAAATVADLNRCLVAAGEADSGLRFSAATPVSAYVELSHPSPEQLTVATRLVEDWWHTTPALDNHRLRWTQPLECKTFQGQLTNLRLEANDEDEPPRLVMAASTEELHQDIDTQFHRIMWRWVYPTLAVGALLTLGLVLALTRSLTRLAKAAPRLADPDTPVTIVGGGSREVTQLAEALTDMVGKLRDTAARFQTILRTAGEGIVVAHSDGIIEEANHTAATMFAYANPGELVGVPVSRLVEGELIVGSSGDKLSGGDLQGLRRDGSHFWLEATLRQVELSGRSVVTGVFRDVTERRAAEDEIRTLNADLETRVSIRTAELAEANTKLEVALRQAEAAARAKDTFVANMSHELRQPLHIIIGFTEAIKEDAADAGNTELVPDLDKILGAAKHLLDLINDILDLAKIAAGRMELSLSRFDLNQLVADVSTLVSPLAEKHANTFTVEVAATIGSMTADERRVRQILINLLSNAFKFTRAGTVSLTVKKVEQANQTWVEFAVADTGQGMTEEQRGRLFQRFYQADDTTSRTQGGTGLGLAITQSFNELMGGEPIDVTTAPGQGSRFVVRLPEVVSAASSPAVAAPALTALPPPPSNGRVLVIDDDPMVRELMSRFLAREGFEVVHAADGATGLQLARTLQLAAITLDVMMPGLDGWQVLSELKADPATADIPVVMLTIVDDRGRGFALGAADYLTKPIDWPRLTTILRRLQSPDGPAPILVVDDDEESRALIRRFLEKEGWRVTEAADGEAGLQAVAEDPPALILLDLGMPVLDGFGFLTELPLRFPQTHTPVVILTAQDLTAADFDRLNGRVTKILEKGNLVQFESLAEQVRAAARPRRANPPRP